MDSQNTAKTNKASQYIAVSCQQEINFSFTSKRHFLDKPSDGCDLLVARWLREMDSFTTFVKVALKFIPFSGLLHPLQMVLGRLRTK